MTYSESRMQMKGSEIFKSSVKRMASFAAETLQEAGVSLGTIDVVVPHQANLRILEAVSRRMGVPIERFAMNIESRGNTSAATVPTALHEAIEMGQIKRGQTLLLNVFGAGVTFGATVLKY